MLSWLSTHWELVALVAGVLISILNAATTHWSEHKGLVKVLLFIVDCLSLIRSRGTEGGALGNAKLPLIPTGATGITDGKVIRCALPFLLLAGSIATPILGASGCGSIRWVPRGATVAPPASQPATAQGEWSADQCRSQQTKATLLLALSAVFASSGSVSGVVAAAIHDEKTASIVTGSIAAAFALGTVITVPLLSSAKQNLSRFCVEYQVAALRRDLALVRLQR